jgi:quinol monooxygenase YgiN
MNEDALENETTAQIAIAGQITVRAEDQDRLVNALRHHVPEARRKDGCLAYSFAIDVLEPGVIRMSELWRELPSLERHLTSNEFQDTLKQLADIEFIDRRVHRLDISGAMAILPSSG